MLSRTLRTRAVALSMVLVVTVFIVDLCLPLGVASAVPYTFAVLLALTAKPRWIGPTVALLCCVLTLAKIEISPDRGTTEMWKVIANRCLALFAIIMTTLLGVLRQRAADAMKQRDAEFARLTRFSMLGQVAAGLAHELNQPLAAVCLQADLAAQCLHEPDTNPELTASLQEIAEQSRRAAEIVRSIRRMASRTAPAQDEVNLNEVVLTAVRLMDYATTRAGIRVETSLMGTPVTLGDRIQLEQVLVILLQNAVEAIVERGDGDRTIRVDSTVEASQVVLLVTDTGTGIAEPARIFDRFYTTKPDGLGLGLAMARTIAETHDGRLVATSTHDGAVFALTLPAHTMNS